MVLLATVGVSGVQPDQENSLQIKWFEILDGFALEISEQTQQFMADGSTLIDASHNHTQFDFDNDGVSNLDERLSGSCVWSAGTDPCKRSNPATGNLFLNGDFSNGQNYWWPTNLLGQEGEICVATPTPTPKFRQLGYSERIRIEENATYRISFDMKAQTNSEVIVELTLPEFNAQSLFSETVAVSSAYRPNTMVFNNSDRDWDSVAFHFTLGDGSENLYCADNISIVKE